MQVKSESVKTRPTVKDLDSIKVLLSHEVHTQLNGIIFGLTQVIHKSGNLEPIIRNNLNMIVENGNLLLALFDEIMDEAVIMENNKYTKK